MTKTGKTCPNSGSLTKGPLAEPAAVPIIIGPETDAHALTTLRPIERFTLSLCEAAYLKLVERRDLQLASLDKQLRAAKHVGRHRVGGPQGQIAVDPSGGPGHATVRLSRAKKRAVMRLTIAQKETRRRR